MEPGDTTSTATLDQLVGAWKQLKGDLLAAEAGSDHAGRLDDANQRAADARIGVDDLAEAVRSGAHERLGRFEGSSQPMRVDHLRQAEEHLRLANRRAAAAVVADESARATVDARTPGAGRVVHIVLSAEWLLADRDGVAVRLSRLDELGLETRGQLSDVQTSVTRLTETLGRAERDAERFASAATTLGVDPTPGMAPFVGTAEAAIAGARDRIEAHRQAQQVAQAAVVAWRDALDAVRAIARDDAWAEVASPLKQRCLRGDSNEVGAGAAAWARDLAIRSTSLRDDLGELDRHRDVLVVTLEDLGKTQLRLLREVQSCSRLPPGMGDMSRQAAFKIDFVTAPPAEARGRLSTRVDSWARWLADDPKRSGRADQRYRWLADATRDLVVDRPKVGPWSVHVLKPGVDGIVEYKVPERINKEFSGGQELTLAVLLYCTLSQVRAQNRTGGPRPAGVLLLDNPFGTASNAALIGMQHALAAQAGLQLVCATALVEASVVSAFDGVRGRVLPLRNARDQRHGLKYLRIADPVVARAVQTSVAGGRPPDDPEGWLDARAYSVGRSD